MNDFSLSPRENSLAETLFTRYPSLVNCRDTILKAFEILKMTYELEGKVLICGNGGSASDCEHIVGELMKGFVLPREYGSKSLPDRKLQKGLPAISLVSHSSLISAIANDNGADLVFAQQVLGYGKKGDAVIGLSTSGNSGNVVNAMKLARELGLHTIGFTGEKGGILKENCDTCICVPAYETFKIQEYHLPIYHLICMMLEYHFFEN